MLSVQFPVKSAQRQKITYFIIMSVHHFYCLISHDDHVTAQILKYNDSKTNSRKEKVDKFIKLSKLSAKNQSTCMKKVELMPSAVIELDFKEFKTSMAIMAVSWQRLASLI